MASTQYVCNIYPVFSDDHQFMGRWRMVVRGRYNTADCPLDQTFDAHPSQDMIDMLAHILNYDMEIWEHTAAPTPRMAGHD